MTKLRILRSAPKTFVYLISIMKKIFALTALISSSFFGLSQNFNRPIPDGLFPYEFASVSELSSGYILTTAVKMFVPPSDPEFISPYPVIFDKNGYVIWYTKPQIVSALDFKFLPTKNQYVFSYHKQGVMYALVMDDQFNSLDTLVPFSKRDPHDIQVANNGNWIIPTMLYDTMDLSAYTFDGTQGSVQTIVRGWGHEEIDPSGNLIAEWNSNDFVHPSETYDFWGYNANDFDYCHGNAIAEDTDGNFLMSYRHLNSVHKVDRTTGEIIWRLGGELSDFTFTNDGGFSGQHDIRRLPNGDVSIFDNGNMTGVTRGVTYSLDTTNWTATKTSEYLHPDAFSANAMGSYRFGTDNNDFIGYGMKFAPNPGLQVVDSSHNQLARISWTDSVVSYRYLPFELSLPTQPEIVCNWNGSEWELTTANAYNSYAWSTGESTASISISQSGTYQVWVEQGVGMIGSQPLVVIDVHNPCSVGIQELNTESGRYDIYNVRGIKIETPEPFTVYFKVYESGVVEKVIFTE